MALTSAELTVMRDTIELLLPDTCNIVTISRTADGEGGFAETRGTSGTSIPCRLDAMQGREQAAGGAVQAYITYMLSLPYDATVLPDNLIEHGGVGYAVKSVNRGQSWQAVVRCELERL